MEIQENIVNKVAMSGLITFDLAELRHPGERVLYDIKDNLFQGLILREKDFREFVKQHDWAQYQGKNVAVTCTADAIVPTWAYMLIASKLEPFANFYIFGDLEALETALYLLALEKLPLDKYKDQRLVVKGCGDIAVPTSAYMSITGKLTQIAKSVMYGEPCSTVPIFKRKD
ncbi:hypothetical protein BCY91_13905 [Pelobium manganitolerans]|uniref:DUF2480 domain-containing protein n=1 Tax=Pelobium manganitolerans TaxID=1842495 RepID=A0A419SA82_9SPHI|nr:DUF2480 family protein [Pelobium manganitolerans]RKD18968.1 hypothetical protein BCY91_13905 [Pelobium manganitolerans]